jgi:hypothetical protein
VAQHQKTLKLLEVAREVLAEYHPMTVRQVYYQLVSRQVIENNRGQYQAVSSALVDARKEGFIAWEWIEDRLRRPREVSMYRDLSDFLGIVAPSYRREVWSTQLSYLEVWLEKDALSGIFLDELDRYGVTLNVGRGYDGWDSIHHAAERYRWHMVRDRPVTILYFGDFDPSGEDMVRSLGERLAFFHCGPEIVKCALIPEDITRYQLPPDFTKQTDTRRAAFVAKYGDLAVELDALPVEVLRARLVEAVEAMMAMDALRHVHEREAEDNRALQGLLRRG